MLCKTGDDPGSTPAIECMHPLLVGHRVLKIAPPVGIQPSWRANLQRMTGRESCSLPLRLQPTVPKTEDVIEAVEDLFVMRNRDDGRLLLRDDIAAGE